MTRLHFLAWLALVAMAPHCRPAKWLLEVLVAREADRRARP